MRFAGARAVLRVLCFAVLCVGSICSAAAEQNVKADLLEFHSGFWINLHHFLYRQAFSLEPQKGRQDLSVAKADTDEMGRLSAEERDAWNEALSYYGRSLAKRDLLFDDELIQAKDQLEDAENSSDLADVKIQAELKAVLLKAAPVYRKHWWARHNTENRKWIAGVEPLVRRYGSTLSARLSRIYEEPWPQYPVRVDAVVYANWAGAYTTLGPTRPTISTTDPGNQGVAALEIVFHETSHGMVDKMVGAMRSAETKLDAHGSFHSGSLWHAVLFYTAGELVAEQVPGYIAYADKNGLWARAWPAPDRALIEQDWKPRMDGSIPLQQAASKLIGDMASQTN